MSDVIILQFFLTVIHKCHKIITTRICRGSAQLVHLQRMHVVSMQGVQDNSTRWLSEVRHVVYSEETCI